MSLLKVGVTLAGLYYVLSDLDMAAVYHLFENVRWGWMAVGAILMAFSVLLRAFRWHVVLRGVGSTIRFSRLVALYLVGSFFNAFLPSGVGGDVVRAAEAAQDVESGVAVGTVLLDRLSGLLALFGMALAVLPFRPSGFPTTLAWTIGSISTAGLVTGFVLIDGRLFRVIINRLPPKFRLAGGGFLDRLASAIRNCTWRSLAYALLISVLFNLIQVSWWATTGLALGLSIPFSYYLLVVPILSLALLVPSIGGLGIRENLAPSLFSGAGVSPEAAVALTLLVFGLERVASLLGAPVYLFSTLRAFRGSDRASGNAIRPN